MSHRLSSGAACVAGAILAAAALFNAPVLAAGQKAGVAAAVNGPVTRIAYANVEGGKAAEGAVGKNITSGDPILLGDLIRSGPDSSMQILLLDQTTFTVGPNSEMVIDKFVYDPETGKGELAATTLKGTFRFISGKIAAKDPTAVTIKTPVATMGIRGTSANIHNTISSSLFLLTGPGQNNNTGDRTSRIIVNGGGESEQVYRVGFFSEVGGPGQTPTPAQQATADLLIALFGGLPLGQSSAGGGSGGGSGSSGGSGSGSGSGAGQGTASGLQGSGSVAGLNLNAQTGQQIIDNTDTQEVQNFLGQITRVADLLSVQTGRATFAVTGTLTAIRGTGQGEFKSETTINFAQRTVVGRVQAEYILGGGIEGAGLGGGDGVRALRTIRPRFRTVTFDNSDQPVFYGNDPGAALAAGVFDSFSAVDNGNFTCDGSACGTGPTPGPLGNERITIVTQFNNNTATGTIAASQNVGVVIDDGTNTIAGSGQGAQGTTLPPPPPGGDD